MEADMARSASESPLLTGIRSPRIQDAVEQALAAASEELNEEELKSEEEEEDERVFFKQSELLYQPKSDQRNWLRKHGKAKYIDFDEQQMQILNDCFQELDDDGSQAIGVEELEDPLIALGLVDSRKQVENMVYSIDDDGNIEFNEFLKLCKGKKRNKTHMKTE